MQVSKKTCTFAPAFETSEHWRDGRVVDYSSLENYRTERYRGFESLSLRKETHFSFIRNINIKTLLTYYKQLILKRNEEKNFVDAYRHPSLRSYNSVYLMRQ